MLVAPDSSGALGREARRQQRRDRIAQRRRESGRPLASALHDLGTDAFEKLGTLERELAREFGMSTGRVEDLVHAAVRT